MLNPLTNMGLTFGTVSCLLCVPNNTNDQPHITTFRYKIIAPAACDKAGGDLKKAAEAILEGANLDPEQYRLGHTKARFIMSKNPEQLIFFFFFIIHANFN